MITLTRGTKKEYINEIEKVKKEKGNNIDIINYLSFDYVSEYNKTIFKDNRKFDNKTKKDIINFLENKGYTNINFFEYDETLPITRSNFTNIINI